MKPSLGISILRVTATVFVVLFHSLGYYTHAWPFDGIKVNTYSSFDAVLNQITMPTFFFLSAYISESKYAMVSILTNYHSSKTRQSACSSLTFYGQ